MKAGAAPPPLLSFQGRPGRRLCCSDMARRLDARQVREAVFLVIGLSTPVGILAVNGSAFIMGHLAEFRLAIAVCALASGLSLNGLGAWAALNRAQRYLPD